MMGMRDGDEWMGGLSNKKWGLELMHSDGNTYLNVFLLDTAGSSFSITFLHRLLPTTPHHRLGIITPAPSPYQFTDPERMDSLVS